MTSVTAFLATATWKSKLAKLVLRVVGEQRGDVQRGGRGGGALVLGRSQPGRPSRTQWAGGKLCMPAGRGGGRRRSCWQTGWESCWDQQEDAGEAEGEERSRRHRVGA